MVIVRYMNFVGPIWNLLTHTENKICIFQIRLKHYSV